MDDSHGLSPDNLNDLRHDALTTRTRQSLDTLEAAQSTLEDLSVFLRDRIKILREKHTSLVSRTYTFFFPDDVLSEILAYILAGVEGDAKWSAPFHLSQVSSQYRRVALTSSRLWTYMILYL